MSNQLNEPPGEIDLLRWSEALAGIARTGLGFTDSLYEKERYGEVLAIAAEIRSKATDTPEPKAQVTEWMRQVEKGVAGYVTPKISAGAVVGNDKGELLLIRRSDSGRWMLPTGWADVGYSPVEVAVKEVWEETQVRCEPVRLVAVLDAMRHGITRKPFYSLVFLCKSIGDNTPVPHPLECLDAGFFAADSLPDNSLQEQWWTKLAFRAIDGHTEEVHFDPPRSLPWASE